MREKIIKIIEPTLNQNWESFASWDEIEKMVTEIISTLIESLPEEIPNTKRIYDYENGYNKYRSEVINLLRGTK